MADAPPLPPTTVSSRGTGFPRPPPHERPDKTGCTVLMEEKYKDCIKNGQYYLNLHQCCDSQLIEPAQQLVSHDPRLLTVEDDKGLLPFWYAGLGGWTDLLPMLISAARGAFTAAEAHRVTVGCRRHDGQTLLHIAAANDYESLTAMLIRYGAEVDAKTDRAPGVTPLMICGQFNSTRVAALLCRNGAQLNMRTNEHNYTAFHFALSYQNTELAAFLHAKGARSGCDAKRCTKCRLQSTRMTRRLQDMKARVREGLSAAHQEEQKRREIDSVIDDMMFADFEAALQDAASGVEGPRGSGAGDEQGTVTQIASAGETPPFINFEEAPREVASEAGADVESASTPAGESSGKRTRRKRGGAKKKK